MLAVQKLTKARIISAKSPFINPIRVKITGMIRVVDPSIQLVVVKIVFKEVLALGYIRVLFFN